jgi:hypothetical protein
VSKGIDSEALKIYHEYANELRRAFMNPNRKSRVEEIVKEANTAGKLIDSNGAKKSP